MARMSTYEAYECMRRAKGVRNADVARACGVRSSTFCDWKRGKSEPKLDKIYKICEYFGVSISTYCELVYKD